MLPHQQQLSQNMLVGMEQEDLAGIWKLQIILEIRICYFILMTEVFDKILHWRAFATRALHDPSCLSMINSKKMELIT